MDIMHMYKVVYQYVNEMQRIDKNLDIPGVVHPDDNITVCDYELCIEDYED